MYVLCKIDPQILLYFFHFRIDGEAVLPILGFEIDQDDLLSLLVCTSFFLSVVFTDFVWNLQME